MSDIRSSGLLVAVEGIDGAGKTTQVRLLERGLGALGIQYHSTKEPTQGQWGQMIRSSAQLGRLPPDVELDAFLRDRREHVEHVLKPALERGLVVLVDRYYLSTVAYQGARGLDPSDLLLKNAFAPSPDIIIVLDVAPQLGLKRIRERGDHADHFEKEEELAKARQIFQTLSVQNLTLIDGTLSISEIAMKIARSVLTALQDKSALPPSSNLETLLEKMECEVLR